MNTPLRFTALALLAGFTSQVSAVPVVYNVSLNGANELLGGAGSGDLDGSAVGTFSLDADTNMIAWSLTLANLAAPTAFHIHTGTAIQQGGVLIGLGVGGLSGNSFVSSITVSGGDIADLATVLANPSGHYLNIHNGEFGGGAVRAQVPEPTAALLTLIGALACASRRPRRC